MAPIGTIWNQANSKLPEHCSKPVYDDPYVEPSVRNGIQPNRDVEKQKMKTGIPKRYQKMTLEYIESKGIPEQTKRPYFVIKQYINNLAKMLNMGQGLLLRGDVGTMKTSLAVAVMYEVIKLGGSAYFISMVNLMDSLFSVSDEERQQLEDKLRRVDLLVIDDLGMEYDKGWVPIKVRAIINHRFDNEKSVIITTNLGSDIKNVYIKGMLDRIEASSLIVDFRGESLRERMRTFE